MGGAQSSLFLKNVNLMGAGKEVRTSWPLSCVVIAGYKYKLFIKKTQERTWLLFIPMLQYN